MGGLAGVRRGRTAGDLTGGGGRSVEAVRRGGDPRRSGLSRAFGQGYYGPPSREVPAGGWEPPPPGGGYSGGVIPRFQSGDRIRPRFDQFGNRRPVKIRNPNQLGDPGLLEHWQNTNAARRATVAAARRANQAQQQASRSPGGWQAGGQFPEASFPVENQLADESPWYPDEEVGYEEEFPTQGGFDIFGRGGG